MPIRLVLVFLVALVAGCGSPEEQPAPTMPAVEGQRLDVALSDLARVGVDKDDVEVVGGGIVGVVDESNWTVCSQDPSAGRPIEAVRVVVDRTCTTTGTAEPGETKQGVVATFTVPDLVGKNLQEAQDQLQGLGSYLLDQEDASGKGRNQVRDANWVVCEQRPRPGTTVKVTSVVRLTAVKLGEKCP